jgi:hypothetical protein
VVADEVESKPEAGEDELDVANEVDANDVDSNNVDAVRKEEPVVKVKGIILY